MLPLADPIHNPNQGIGELGLGFENLRMLKAKLQRFAPGCNTVL